MPITDPSIDALQFPTLKYLRQQWWDDEFTSFLRDTLRPRPGDVVLDVGCGPGLAETALGRGLAQVRMVGIDLVPARVTEARDASLGHDLVPCFAVAEASKLPFADGRFSASFTVGVLQHVADEDLVVAEMARVTAPGGRLVCVEPDNASRYAYSSVSAGTRSFTLARRFFDALGASRGEAEDRAVGPRLPAVFTRHDVAVTLVRLFPITRVQLGPPPPEAWDDRRARVAKAVARTSSRAVGELGHEYLRSLDAYEISARMAGRAFVEIQSTLLVATVGEKHGETHGEQHGAPA